MVYQIIRFINIKIFGKKKKICDTMKTVDNSIKGIQTFFGGSITLTDNERTDIMKVIKSLENRGVLLKRTTRKITSQERGYLNFLIPLMTAGLPLIKGVLTKNVLLAFGLSAGMSAVDATIQKDICKSGTTALAISNEHTDNEHIMKTVKSLEESGLQIQGISEKIKCEAKEEKGGLLRMLLGKLAASILGNTLSGRWVMRAGETQLEQVKIFNATPSFN